MNSEITFNYATNPWYHHFPTTFNGAIEPTLASNQRLYIQSKIQPGKYLQKLQFYPSHVQTDFIIMSSSYSINSYPLSFSSLKSVEDHINNQVIMYHQSAYIQPNWSNRYDLQNLELVINNFSNLSSNIYGQVYRSSNHNFDDLTSKAFWRSSQYQQKPVNLVNKYMDLTSFNTRQLGTGPCYGEDAYLVDCGLNFNAVQSKMYELEIGASHSSSFDSVAVLSKDDYHLMCITQPDFANWPKASIWDFVQSERRC